MGTPKFITKPLFLPSGTYIPVFNHFDDDLTEEFKALFSTFLQTRQIRITESFEGRSYKLFDQIKILNKIKDRKERNNLIQSSDKYFANFTIISEDFFNHGKFYEAYILWREVIELTKRWEDKNKDATIHKGTPYYFAGVAALNSRDFDNALIVMRLALQEDKNNAQDWHKTPAYYFLILDDTVKEQYLKQFVEYMIKFLRVRLDNQKNKQNYQKTRNGKLTYEELRKKFFLDNDKIPEEVKYFFVYSTIKCWHLRVSQKIHRNEEVMGPILFMNALGPFLITIEMLLKIKYPKPSNAKSWDFGNVVKKLASNERWTFSELGAVNDARDKNFSWWVKNCLSRDTFVSDFELVYGLRNFTFHNIKSEGILWAEFTKILQSVWNCFFKTVEIL